MTHDPDSPQPFVSSASGKPVIGSPDGTIEIPVLTLYLPIGFSDGRPLNVAELLDDVALEWLATMLRDRGFVVQPPEAPS